jgi:hypothetical protein
MLRKEPPRFILRNQGQGPYDHIPFPIGGLSLNSASTGRTSGDGKSKLYLPDVLPIRLPSPEDAPQDLASPETLPQRTVPSATVVSLPPAPAISEPVETRDGTRVVLPPKKPRAATQPKSQAAATEGQRPSGHVQEFLKQIPDLSYMLSSKLSIPHTKS